MIGLSYYPVMPRYTRQDERIIRENYLKLAYSAIGILLDGRSHRSISEKIRQMGLPRKLDHIMSRKKSKHYKAYSSWAAMIQRCSNRRRDSWVIYGEKGIRVCDRWRKSFWDFLSDMGEKPAGYSIDRINPNGNYEPSNCRWIPIREQRKTTRDYLANRICIDCNKRRVTHVNRCHRCNEYFRRNHIPRPRKLGWLKT